MILGWLVEFSFEKRKKLGRILNQENILLNQENQVITGYLIETIDDKKIYHIPYFDIIKLFEPEEKKEIQENIFPSPLLKMEKKKKSNTKEDWQCPDVVDDLPF